MTKFILATIALGLLVSLLAGQKSSPSPSSALVTRGRYLVEDVGLCGDCHTPQDERGAPIKSQWLQGAPLTFKPTVPVPGWVERAPAIAGLPGFDQESAVKFLTTGLATNGAPANPPMPQFRFNHQDAAAIVAYLKAGPEKAK